MEVYYLCKYTSTWDDGKNIKYKLFKNYDDALDFIKNFVFLAKNDLWVRILHYDIIALNIYDYDKNVNLKVKK